MVKVMIEISEISCCEEKPQVKQNATLVIDIGCCKCSSTPPAVFKSITIGEAIVDCTGANLNIPITLVGLDANGEVNVLLSFDNGLTWMTNGVAFFGEIENIPISHTGQGVGNGNYILKLQSVEDPTVESNVISFEINCPFERSIVDLDAVFTPEPNATGDPVDVTINFNLIDGYDGTNPVGWLGTETFQLQHDDGNGGWIDIGAPFTAANPTLNDVQLPNGTYITRLVCVENNIISSDTDNDYIGFWHLPATVIFSCNLWGTTGDDTGNVDGYVFKVIIDGVEYEVVGTPAMTPSQMHIEMYSLIKANNQGVICLNLYVNGSPSNYGYYLAAPVGSNGTWNAKVITIVVTEGGNPRFANATIGGYAQENAGVGSATGTFTGGY